MDITQRALHFLSTTLFELYIFILVLRMILAWVYANYYQPVTEFVVKMTNPLVKPVRRIIPNYNGFELSTLLVIFILECVKVTLSLLILRGVFPNVVGLLLMAIAETLHLALLVFFYAILLQAILSWVQPFSPINRVLMQVTAPILKPLQRVIPRVNGIDISPIPALIILQLLIIAIVDPLKEFSFLYI